MNEEERVWAERPMPWQVEKGPEGEIVLFSEAVLGRGLWSFSFPNKAADVERRTVLGEVVRRLAGWDDFLPEDSFTLEEGSLPLRRCLFEKGLIEAESAQHAVGRGLLIGSDSRVAVVINEEDHLRIKAWQPGFDPTGALASALALEERLDQKLEFAFSDEFGYLTACPTRVGTGLCLTSLLHLPGLVMAGEIERIVNALRQLQFMVHGLGGRGKAVQGCIFLVSNLITLGRSEQDVAEDFALHVGKIVLHERSARRQLFSADAMGLEDLIFRSQAVAQNARLMSLQEGFDRLSHLRLGAGLGILPDLATETFNRLLVSQQPGHLELVCDNCLRGKDMLRARADLFRDTFTSHLP